MLLGRRKSNQLKFKLNRPQRKPEIINSYKMSNLYISVWVMFTAVSIYFNSNPAAKRH